MTLPNFIFRDRENYETYVNHLDGILYSYSENDVVLFFNEPIFLFINYILGVFFTGEQVVYLFVFFIVTSVFFLLRKYSSNLLMFILGLCAFLVISYTFHFQFVILRQALATLLILYSIIYIKSKRNIFLISLAACFIHSSMFALLLIISINFIFKDKSFNFRCLIISFIFGFFGFFVLKIAELFGIRQAQYLLEFDYTPGGGAFLLWLGVLLYLLYYYRGFKDNIYEYGVLGLVAFISLYFINPIAGRLMCSFVPIILLILIRNFNFGNIFILLTLIIVYVILIFNGVLVENSLLVNGDVFFKYISQTFPLKEF